MCVCEREREKERGERRGHATLPILDFTLDWLILTIKPLIHKLYTVL